MAIVDRKFGQYRIVLETTTKGRVQVALGRKDRVVEIPSGGQGIFNEPIPVALGKGESITVYNSNGEVIIKS